MTQIDIISGFLGAGKTTLIKKLLSEAFQGQKNVLIENEFGEIGIDGGFLKDSGIVVHEMNAGCICVFGNAGDATGYAMRGGRIFVGGNVGYRCGIHMKAYKENKPAIVIGGKAGSFLGEYQAGGIIVVLGDGAEGSPVGNFCGTGMHGGEMYIRGDALPKTLPPQVKAERLERFPEGEAAQLVRQWCDAFGKESERYLSSPCFRLTPDSANPYKQMYTPN